LRRRILAFVNILIFVWISLLLGLWVINWVIIPWKLPEPFSMGMTNVVQVVISTVLVLLWLYLWKRIATKMFWKAMSDIK
jgi:hypothetical protein